MRSSLSFNKLLLKKMPFNYSEHSALAIYFAFCKHRVFLFAQKNQLMLKKLLKFLIGLTFNLSYLLINTSFVKLLFKQVCHLNFLFRELILIFFNDDLLVRDLLVDDTASKSIIFLCYNSFFLSAKFLPVIGKFVDVFSRNLSAFKANTSFAVYCVAYYAISMANQTIS